MLTALESVTVGYDRRPVLNDLSLSIPGGIVGLLGANGAGKTTLLRLLATQLRPVSGRVTVAGHRLVNRRAVRAARRELGFLPQSWGCHRSFTARDFVIYCGALRGIRSRALTGEADTALASVDLHDIADVQLRKLSGGQRQRAGIAATIVGKPSVVLLDEPTVGLDPEQRMEFRRLMVRLCEEIGATILLSTHLVEDITQMASHVAVIEAGDVCFTGTPHELASHGGSASDIDTPMERGYLAVRGRVKETTAS
ncbi:MAG TPA: ATP-binding cassette domain-containing protein [Candidatus Stackebrandtia excrementipullorum]|nr:ATP-binding cassette domain-containing protein [Candidatus Stackebrandtia excrementipullorum]